MNRRKPYVRIARSTDQARRLCEVRLRHGLSFRGLASVLGKPESYATALCRMETGKRKIPDAIIRQLARIYDVRPETLRAGQLELDLLIGITAPSQLPTDPLLDATPEEREELIRYLAFLRLKQSRARESRQNSLKASQ